MIRSLRARVVVALVGVLIATLATFSLVLDSLFAHALVGQLDGELREDASALAGMVEQPTADEPWEFEAGPLPDFDGGAHAGYFEIWLPDGTVLVRSASLRGRELFESHAAGTRTPPSVALAHDVTLPDGRLGRAIALRLPARAEDPVRAAPGAAVAPGDVTVVVARGTDDIARTLGTTRRWLVALTLLVIACASGAALLAVSRSLRPARALADAVARLDENHLVRAAGTGPPLASVGLPRELAPMVHKLEDLLARLGATLERERGFTADVSHELRTPLAALRTTIEVARARERTPPEYQHALDEAHGVVTQMHGLVEGLLTLSRFDAGQLQVREETIGLRDLVDQCWSVHVGTARQRRLTFANQLAPEAVVRSDPDKVRVLLGNLLANAAAYTAEGGDVVVRAGTPPTLFEVTDSGPPIPQDLLPRLFDRFVRGDAARVDTGQHAGIGLAVVRAVSRHLGLTVRAENRADGAVAFVIARVP